MEPIGQEEDEQTGYIPDEFLRAAGIHSERLSIENVRHELYELEPDIATERRELESMQKEYDELRRAMRFSLIMCGVFFLLCLLMGRVRGELMGMAQQAAAQGHEELLGASAVIDVILRVMKSLFYSLEVFFGTRAVYKLYGFFCAYDSELSRRWCAMTKTKNLSDEIFRRSLSLAQKEERQRQLKQVRTMFRERMQEDWLEKNLPERIVMERELSRR